MKQIILISSLFIFCFFLENSLASERLGYAKTRIQIFEKAIDNFQKDTGQYPTTEQGLYALINTPVAVSNWKGPYLPYPLVPRDPWDEPYIYFYPAKFGNKKFDIYSKGKNRLDEKGSGDDISSWAGYNRWEYNKKAVFFQYATLLIAFSLLILLAKRLLLSRKQRDIKKKRT